MANYNIIASDLDGTLLQEDMSLSAENAAAISAIAQKGVAFVPSSGRTLCEIPPAVLNHPDVRYVIYSNGAAIWDKQTKTNTYLCMSRALSNAVLEALTAYDCHILIRHGGQSYVDSRYADQAAFVRYQMCGPHRGVIEKYAVQKEDYLTFVKGLDNIECYALFFSDDAEMDTAAKQLSCIEGLSVVPSWPHSLELFSCAAGKGAALTLLAEMLSTTIDKTIAVGDSGNDKSMVQIAGLGLATANACDMLKQAADAVICANTDHIAQYILEKYI